MTALTKRLLTISVGGTDFTAQVSKALWTSADSDSDFVTFADTAAGGAKDYLLNVVAVQDLVALTFWDKVFTSPGTTAAVLVKPYGNTTATPAQPHFTASITIVEPDGDFLGMEADKSTSAKATIEVAFPSTRPVRVTA